MWYPFPMTADELVPLAADLGGLLLRSGAEIRQVEDGLYAAFAAYGIRCECFVLLKGIFLTAWTDEGRSVTQILHVRDLRGVDLTCLEKALELSSQLGTGRLEAQEVRERIDQLNLRPGLPSAVLLGAAAATAGIYALFFGGSWIAGVWAFLAGLLAQALKIPLGRIKLPSLVETFLLSIFIGAIGLVSSGIFPEVSAAAVMTGGIMILIPGVALVNGLKDIIHGDTVSSLYRLTDALLQTAAIAAGVTLMLSLGGLHAPT